MIEGAVMLCGSEWKYVADVVTDFDGALPMFECQPTEINRIIMNLVVNAAHAVAEATQGGADGKGTITVRTRYDHPYAEILVEDTGVGIPEDIRPRIFDLFFTTKDIGMGTDRDWRWFTRSSKSTAARSTLKAKSAKARRSSCVCRFSKLRTCSPRRRRPRQWSLV